MLESSAPLVQNSPDERWRFLRDVAVFQLKMFVDNLRDLALILASVGAALVDLVSKGVREGTLFYRVLRWGAHSEKMIDVYSVIENQPLAEKCRSTPA